MTRPGGFSRSRLDRMHDVMAGHVARGDVPGLVTAISRHGDFWTSVYQTIDD